ncbi:hypothetical protein ACEPAG_3636 [Sanghuangporus baumii]
MKPRFYNERFPYLCAVPKTDALWGFFLEPFRSIDVVPCGNGNFILSPSQIDLWEAFESCTFRLCRGLLQRVNMTLEFSLPIFPCKIGYAGVAPDYSTAMNRARRSQRAFCILFDMATYLIALTPDWKGIGKAEGLPDEFLEGLEHSPIANFTFREGRVGTFIDFSESIAEIRHLPDFIRKHIPFWIFWGDGKSYRIPMHDKVDLRMAEMLRPSYEEVASAKENNGDGNSFQFESIDSSSVWDYERESPAASIKAPLVANPSTAPRSVTDNIVTGKLPRSNESNLVSIDHTNKSSHSINASLTTKANLTPVEPYTGFVLFKPGQVEKGSRQNPFESPEQFWARQHTEDEESLSKMSEADRKRLKNERNGGRITKKSKVFHWEKFSWGYVRRRVSRKELDDYSEYPPSQMRFSVTRNEWDVCSNFDPDASPSFPDPDSDDSCDFPRLQNSTSVSVPRRPSPDKSAEHRLSLPDADEEEEEGEILESDHFQMHSDAALPSEMVFSQKRFQEALKTRYSIRSEVKVRSLKDVELDRMLYYRYGLLLPNVHLILSLDNESASVVREEQARSSWATTRGILYDIESSTESFTLIEMLGIIQFVRGLLENLPIPSTVLDIHPDNIDSPAVREMRKVSFSLNLQKCTLDGFVYLLRPNDLDFIIAIEQPSLVVELLRRGCLTGRELVHLLHLFVRRGSPFRTLCFAKEPSIRLDPLTWDLGSRTLDEEPGAYAYAQYEKLLQLFMRQPRARSIFGLGGPVWRAILEVCGSYEDIPIGPSVDTDVFGRKMSLPNGEALLEEVLTGSELLFLCGTYKVKKGRNVMLYSWWPTPKQWMSATSNVRYWSPGNERWFMTHLHEIRNGRATWVHVPKWTEKLKFNKKTKRLMEKNDDICRGFLDSMKQVMYYQTILSPSTIKPFTGHLSPVHRPFIARSSPVHRPFIARSSPVHRPSPAERPVGSPTERGDRPRNGPLSDR